MAKVRQFFPRSVFTLTATKSNGQILQIRNNVILQEQIPNKKSDNAKKQTMEVHGITAAEFEDDVKKSDRNIAV